MSGQQVGNAADRMLRLVDCSTLAVEPTDFVCQIATDAPVAALPGALRLMALALYGDSFVPPSLWEGRA